MDKSAVDALRRQIIAELDQSVSSLEVADSHLKQINQLLPFSDGGIADIRDLVERAKCAIFDWKRSREI